MKEADIEVSLLDSMGSDLTVVNAARVSFNKESTLGPGESLLDKDKRLIKYLAAHNHWTVFGHCTAQFRIKAPVFVARQLVKHTVGLVWNEVSRRYVDDEPEFWFPKTWRARPEGSIKQGSGGNITSVRLNDEINADVRTATKFALSNYNELLSYNVSPEQARMVLPLNTMTEWYWTGSLAAWARVCNLRLDAHSQQETREVALLISKAMERKFPVSWDVLVNLDLRQPTTLDT